MYKCFTAAFVLCLCGPFGGCRLDDSLTGAEAREALDESAVSSQAVALSAASVEVSTNFTIGDAIRDAAAELQDFIESQLPCAEIQASEGRLSIEYGARPGECSYAGHHFEGRHTIEIERNDAEEVVVMHGWDEFTNGAISVSGSATVTWSLEQKSRHVVHELTWTRLSDGRVGVGSGDRLQKPMSGGVLEGIVVDGERAWDGDSGHWALDIDGIQLRWEDPVPQAGSWTLDTPFDKRVTLVFDRIDETTIGVTIRSRSKTVELKVGKLGVVSRR